MHNGDEALFNTIKFLKKPDLVILEKPFKVVFSNGKVRMEIKLLIKFDAHQNFIFFLIRLPDSMLNRRMLNGQ